MSVRSENVADLQAHFLASLPEEEGSEARTLSAEVPLAAGDQTPLPLVSPNQAGAPDRLGHYEILAVVGQGGFGTVFKAFDTRLHRFVAIKMLTAEMASNDSARQRFLREARTAAAVRHEYVVDIHQVEEEPTPYLVMEFIDGPTLAEKLASSGPLPLPDILRIGSQTALGLAAAHKIGLIHRDIKPGNLLLERDGQRVKISDFGLARAVRDPSVTGIGVVAGTPAYMAPEQALGQPLDHRVDLFSLGSTLYEMCTGSRPFPASGALAVLKRVCNDTPRPIRESNSAIPDWLADIVARLHAKDRTQRFQSAEEVAGLLACYLTEQQPLSEATLRPAQPGPALQAGPLHSPAEVVTVSLLPRGKTQQGPQGQPQPDRTPSRRTRQIVGLLVSVLFLLCVGLGVTWWTFPTFPNPASQEDQGKEDGPPAESPAPPLAVVPFDAATAQAAPGSLGQPPWGAGRDDQLSGHETAADPTGHVRHGDLAPGNPAPGQDKTDELGRLGLARRAGPEGDPERSLLPGDL